MRVLKVLVTVSLIATLLFGVSSAVFAAADDDPSISIAQADGVFGSSKLVFTAKASPEIGRISTINVSLAYDNTVIIPANANTGVEIDDITSKGMGQQLAPFKNHEDFVQTSDLRILDNGNLTTFDIVINVFPSDPGVDCQAGVALLEFYFKLKAGKTEADMNANTFKLAATESHPNFSINLGSKGGVSYLYGTSNDRDTLTLTSFTYTGWDVIPSAPTITGPTALTLTEGYAATSTDVYTIGGTAPVTVRKTSGNAAITWNDAEKRLDIAAGLPAGEYPVVLAASNGIAPNAELTFTLTVEPAPVVLESIKVTTLPTKTIYTQGETLALAGLVVTATYSDSSTKQVSGYSASPAEGAVLNTLGTTTVTVSYTEDGVTRTDTFTVTVNLPPVVLESITVTTQPTKTVYTQGETLALAGLVVTATYSDSSTKQVSGYSASPAEGAVLNTLGTTTVTVSYTEDGLTRTDTFTVTVNLPPVVLESITVTTQPTKTVYTQGETLALAGLVVTATYSDSSTKQVSGYSASPAEGAVLNTLGTTTVTVSYTEDGVTRTDTFTVTVNLPPVVLESIKVTTQPTKTVYTQGETLALTGLVVTATYSDSSTKQVSGYSTSPANGAVLNTLGTTTVTVSYTEDGVTRTDTFTVTVNLPPVVLESIKVTTLPTKTIYTQGETLALAGLVVTATYSDSSTAQVSGYSTSPANGAVLNTVGTTTVTVSYTEDGVTRTDTFTVTVNLPPVVLESIKVTTQPTKTIYTQGETLALAGLVVTATYSDSSTKQVSGYSTSPANGAVLNTVGTTTVTVSYTEDGVTRTDTFTVTVNLPPVVLESIKVTTLPTKTVYTQGETLALAGLVVTATYSDSSTKQVSGYSTSPANGAVLNTVGTTTVTVSYTEDGVTRTDTFTVTVNLPPVVLDSIKVTTQPTKTVYIQGETLALAGLVVTATYSDSSTKQVSSYSTSPANGAVLNTLGTTTVTVSYTEDGVTRTDTFTVTVNLPPVVLDSIKVTTQPTKTVYTQGETMALAGLVVTATYSDSSTKQVSGYSASPAEGAVLNTLGTTTVTVSYTEDGVTRTDTFTVTVNPPPVVLDSIKVTTQPTKTVYTQGETLALAGLVVTATYSDSSTAPLTGYSTSPAEGAVLNTVGITTVTVSYSEGGVTWTDTFTVTVNLAPVPPSITGPTTLSLTEGYAATSTGVYTISGTAPVTVTKTSGNAAIAWNDTTKRLDIAAGLPAGSYPVVLTATNGILPNATLTFTLTVNSSAAQGIIVNFPGIKSATVKYYTNESGWQTVGVFDDSCEFTIPDHHKATWGQTTVQVLKDGMWFTFSGLTIGEGLLVLDVPLKTITVIGIAAPCELGLVQEDWVYRPAAALVGLKNEFLVFDNGKAYEVKLQKPGFHTIAAGKVNAGDTVDFSPCFYAVTVPADITNVRMQSNNWIVNGANAGDTIPLLWDIFDTAREASMTFVYGGLTHTVNFLLDGTDPFSHFDTGIGVIEVATAIVEKLTGNQNKLTITVTKISAAGVKEEFSATFTIDNNSAGTYTVGPYKVYVNTKGNDQIRECYIVK